MEVLIDNIFTALGLAGFIKLGVGTYVDVKMKLRELDKNGHQKLKY